MTAKVEKEKKITCPPCEPYRERSESRRFCLDRKVDESGMSGTGKVAEGVVLPNGLAVMWWLVPPNSVQIYPSISDLINIHSHGRGTTDVVWEGLE